MSHSIRSEMTRGEIDRRAGVLKDSADRMVMRGDPRGASAEFRNALALAPGRLDLWLGLAACERASGNPKESLKAVESALGVDPRCFSALLMKGSLLEAIANARLAAVTYGVALSLAPAEDGLPEPTRRAVAHARQVHTAYTTELAANLKQELGLPGGARASAESRRIETFVDTIAGRRKIYAQEPVQFHFPGLRAIEFHERDAFPWLAAFEAFADNIRAELLSVWKDGGSALVPYVSYPDGVPLDQWADLNRSLDWSALHLLRDGMPVEANCARCPTTMKALALVDQPQVPGRSPAAMFSILKPRTRIPPHTGVANTRLVAHLPLIVPEGCGFRVGGATRQWREGHAWVFDDTIEHEAWNDSDQPRAILICDVWSPDLSFGEREAVARLVCALDRFNGGAKLGGEL